MHRGIYLAVKGIVNELDSEIGSFELLGYVS